MTSIFKIHLASFLVFGKKSLLLRELHRLPNIVPFYLKKKNGEFLEYYNQMTKVCTTDGKRIDFDFEVETESVNFFIQDILNIHFIFKHKNYKYLILIL